MGDVSVKVFRDVFEDVFGLFWVEEYDFGVLAGFFNGVDDRYGVFVVIVELFVRFVFDFEDDDCFMYSNFFLFGVCGYWFGI